MSGFIYIRGPRGSDGLKNSIGEGPPIAIPIAGTAYYYDESSHNLYEFMNNAWSYKTTLVEVNKAKRVEQQSKIYLTGNTI